MYVFYFASREDREIGKRGWFVCRRSRGIGGGVRRYRESNNIYKYTQRNKKIIHTVRMYSGDHK